MIKSFSHACYYRIAYADNAFAVYLNDRLVGNIQKSSSGHWPVHVTVNNGMYVFSKVRSLKTLIEFTDTVTGEFRGVIRIPFFSTVYPFVKVELANGKVLTWEVENFFSLHWKWKCGEKKFIDAIENLTGEYNSGVIGMEEYNDETDLLIVCGFFLSLLRRSKLSMGMRGLKRKRI
jgi:hypothetical protein